MRLILPTENKNVARMQRSEIRESNNTNIAQISALFSSLTLRLLACLLSIAIISASPLLEAAGKRKSDKIALLEFRDISVGDALRILSDQSGLNVIASEQASKIKMTMYLHDIAPMDVLEAMAKTYNLWYQKDRRSGVVRVYTVQEFRLGRVDYKNEKNKIYTFKHERNALDFAYIIQDLYGYERVRLNYGANEQDILMDLSDRMQRFDIIARNTMDLGGQSSSFGIESGGSGTGGMGGGSRGGIGGGSRNGQGGNRSGGNRGGNNRGGSSNRGRGGNRQGISSIESNEIIDTQKMLPQQEASGLFSGDIARSQGAMDQFINRVSPIYVTMIRQQNRVLVRTRDQDVIEDLNQLYGELDTDLATLMLEVKLLQIDLNDGYDSVFDFSIDGSQGNITTLSQGDENIGEKVANLMLDTALNVSNPAMVATYVGKKFQARIELLEKEGRVTTLATPMLNTVNQEVSRIFIGEQRPITTNITVTCGQTSPLLDDTTTALTTCRDQAETTVTPIGRTLLLTPNINSNGTVSIRLLVEDSSVCDKCGSIPTQGGDKDVDTVQQETFGGTVIASNNQMIAVGGIIEEQSSDSENKTPILGDIPVLGTLFTEERRSRNRTELVILLRPFIMRSDEQRTETNQGWLEHNSVHPAADDAGNLGIYSNDEREHKDYKLEQPYKQYRLQDQQDSKRWNSPEQQQKRQRKGGKQQNAAQQTYIELTQYAAKAVRVAAHEREVVADIHLAKLEDIRKADLLYDTRLRVIPVVSWRKGGIHVTAVEVYNLSEHPLQVDYKHLKGRRWLAASIENERLSKQGEAGSSTYLYLISAGSFEEALQP